MLAMPIDGADDGVHLPVADLLPQIHCSRSFADVALAREPSALFDAGMLLSPLGRLPQKAEQRASLLLVAADEAVDRLVADLEAVFETEPPADLLGTEAFAQQRHD
jgi:hypothetical protein